MGVRRGLLASLVLVLGASLVAGCDGDPSAEGEKAAAPAEDSAEAVQAAQDYRDALDAWSAKLTHAAKTKSDWIPLEKGGVRWPDLTPLLERAPELAEVEGAVTDGSYAYTAALQERVDGLVDELAAYQLVDLPSRNLASGVYGDYLDHYGGYLKNDNKYYFKLLDVRTDLGFDLPAKARTEARLVAAKVGGDARLKRRYADRVAARGRKASDPLDRSTVAYVVSELEWVIRFEREFANTLRRFGPDSAPFIDPYEERYGGLVQEYSAAPYLPHNVRTAFTKQVAATVAELSSLPDGSGPLPSSAPMVGDLYRAEIVRDIAPAANATTKRTRILTEQLWRLWRLRELEDTPEEVYQGARDSLVLQQVGDARSTYDLMSTPYIAFRSTIVRSTFGDPLDLRPWAEDQWSRPVAPVLEPYRDRLATAALNTHMSFFDDYQKFLTKGERILQQAAKVVDDKKALPKEIRKAVEATRPTAAEDS